MSYLELDPARAKAKDPSDLWDDPTWYAEPKYDGWRFLMHFGEGLPRVFLTGRRTSSRTGFLSEKGLCAPQIWPKIPPKFIKYTVIDGEVMAPTGFRDIAGIMNVEPEDAARRCAEIGPPRYVAFDLLYYDGEDYRSLTQLDRKTVLRPLVESIGNPLITLAPTLTGDKRLSYEQIVSSGGEGVILKDVSGAYGESGAWIKVKKYSTLDVVVTGFTDAKIGVTGKYLGLIGAVKVSVWSSGGELIEVGRVSGMDDDLRREISANKDGWLGRVVEIRAQEFARDRLRHPRFVRERPDADPRQATFAKMLRDLAGSAAPDKDQLDLFR